MLGSRVLVTGGAGFIGCHIVHALMREHDVVVLDDLRTGSMQNLSHVPNGGMSFVRGSVLDPVSVERAMRGCDVVLHMAAVLHGGAQEIHDVNITGTERVLEAAVRHGVRKVILASSAAVYGTLKGPAEEGAALRPISLYGESKVEAEALLPGFELESVALRFFNVFGARQRPVAVVPHFIQKALANDGLVLFGDGHQTRDFVHVSDVVQAVRTVMKDGVAGVFNVGTGVATPLYELARHIVRLAGSDSTIYNTMQTRTGDIRHSVADITRLKEMLVFAIPEQTLATNLSWTINHYRGGGA